MIPQHAWLAGVFSPLLQTPNTQCCQDPARFKGQSSKKLRCGEEKTVSKPSKLTSQIRRIGYLFVRVSGIHTIMNLCEYTSLK
jgi:hypothetical protein